MAMLARLGEGFFTGDSWLGGCEVVNATALPPCTAKLLVHQDHMTAVLNAHCGQDVALQVLDHREEASLYCRKILLTVEGGRRIVEFGIVRMSLLVLPASAREEVVTRRFPLGAILVRYKVLTRVEPRWYLRFSAESPVVEYFAGAAKEAFGRLGVIHCNGQPAVELLEVVPEESAI